ncbi:MAG: dCTP deaminase [Pseudanabaena sp. M152S2SP2A07QC]|nr:dCTP deaminase [Pseudanabaena sp. M109S1SP2A07QC]MCA6546620.1 dCTP deaminase [Pseudanabaena sp. M152S2SP2A07QC]
MSFSLLSDREIKELCTGDRPMLSPFCASQIRQIPIGQLPDGLLMGKAISFGLSSYGYDLRLASHDFRIFKDRNIWQKLGLQKTPIIDPKNFDERLLYQAQLHRDRTGEYFIMPPHSSALGVSVECFDMPRNVTGICLGKSTYARSAITPFATPIEAGWRGYPTLEFGNNTDLPCKIYANEGVLQLVFNRGADCETSYGDRHGKYQDQACEVTLAKA